MISIIAGTNRKGALTLQMAQYYHRLLTSLQAPARIIDLAEIPENYLVSGLYDTAGGNTVFNKLADEVETSDKYVFIVPEYNGSFPGILKLFIDGLKYPGSFKNKKVALVGLSAGHQGGGLALSHLSDILAYLGAHVMGNRVKLPGVHKIFDGEVMNDKLIAGLLEVQAAEFVRF